VKMAEEYECKECSTLYDDSDGDTDERMMCNKCIEKIYASTSGDRRNPDIRRSSTKHYPDWNMKKEEYVIPPKRRK